MTLPNTYSWSPVGKRVYVPYEAPQGRRVNAVGALFYGSQRFAFTTRARAPKSKRKSISPLAAGLCESELGVLNAELLIEFIWRIACRPDPAPQGWRREKPLVIVLGNYSVHKSTRFAQEREKWRCADIELFFLPCYSQEL